MAQVYLIIAVVVGAGAGHFVFGDQLDAESVLRGDSAGKGVACH